MLNVWTLLPNPTFPDLCQNHYPWWWFLLLLLLFFPSTVWPFSIPFPKASLYLYLRQSFDDLSLFFQHGHYLIYSSPQPTLSPSSSRGSLVHRVCAWRSCRWPWPHCRRGAPLSPARHRECVMTVAPCPLTRPPGLPVAHRVTTTGPASCIRLHTHATYHRTCTNATPLPPFFFYGRRGPDGRWRHIWNGFHEPWVLPGRPRPPRTTAYQGKLFRHVS